MNDTEDSTKYTPRDVQTLIGRGNRILKKYRIIQELNKLGIRSGSGPRDFAALSEISAALALVDVIAAKQAEKAIKDAGDDIKWL